MTRSRIVEGQMVGLPMPGTIGTILLLTISRMLRGGFVPWMYQFTWEEMSKCMTWQISFDYMPSVVTGESPISYSMGEFALEYSTGDGVSTVVLIHTGSTST
jgi:hypothetical protein